MNIEYIEVRYKISDLKNFDDLLKILPKEIGIVSTLQYLDIAKKIKDKLKSEGFIVYTAKSPYMKYEMQVLGCDPLAAKVPTNSVLFIGDGMFHPIEIARRLKKTVIVYSPITGSIRILEPDRLFEKKITMLLHKLKESKNVGLITSIKPGQYLYKEMIEWKKILDKQGKNVFMFITDNINFNELMNFPDIEFWIIFACPRLIDDILERKINAITSFYLREYCIHHGLCEAPKGNASESSNYKENNN